MSPKLLRHTCLMGLLFFGWSMTTLWSQDIRFQLQWGDQVLNLREPVQVEQQGDTLTLDLFRCYVSGFELWENGKAVWVEEESFHLLDGEMENSMVWEMELPEGLSYDQLRFRFGIDSTTSVSGAMGGDLDPSRGMFWAWNSGYIFLKLEGQSPRSPARKQRFQYHLGGYAAPHACQQALQFDARPGQALQFSIRLDEFLGSLDLSQDHSIMIPGARAVELKDQFCSQIQLVPSDE